MLFIYDLMTYMFLNKETLTWNKVYVIDEHHQDIGYFTRDKDWKLVYKKTGKYDYTPEELFKMKTKSVMPFMNTNDMTLVV